MHAVPDRQPPDRGNFWTHRGFGTQRRPKILPNRNNIVAALKMTSLCGHGGGLGEFADSVLRYYGDALEPCFA